MAAREDARSYQRVCRYVCRDSSRQCVVVGGFCELAPPASLDRHRLSLRRSAQLVRAALFPHAPAGEIRPLAQLFYRRVRGPRRADSGLRFAAGALLREPLDARELAHGDCMVEYSAFVMDSRVGFDARSSEVATRLVLDRAGCFCFERGELV